jgi:hypothetical protein
MIRPALAEETCANQVAVVPPLVRDPVLGRALVSQVLEQLKDETLVQPCFLFQEFEESLDAFDYVGLNFYFSVDPEALGASQVRKLQKSLTATHLLFIRYDPASLRAYAYIYEMVAEGELELKTSQRLKLQRVPLVAAETPTYLRALGLLTPNSVSLGFSQTTVDMDLREDLEKLSDKDRGGLPPILSSISFNKISHRDGFGLFDVGLSVFPGTFLFAINQDTVVAKKTLPQTQEEFATLHVEAYGTCTNLNGEFALYSPLGTTYLSAGYGPCLLGVGKEQQDAIITLNLAGRPKFGHRIFTSQDLYLYLEFDALVFAERIYDSELAHSTSILRAVMGLGWYLTDVESLFIKTWKLAWH